MDHIKTDEREMALLRNPKYVSASEIIILRNYFYRDNFRKLMGLCLLLLVILVAMIFILRFEIKDVPAPRYFATTYDGVPVARVPLGSANLDPNTLITWASEAISAAYTLNFLNYRSALQNARTYFTRKGYEDFLLALKRSKNLEAVQKNKMVVYTKILAAPKITKTSVTDPDITIEGAFTWQVEFPMALILENSNPLATIVQQNNVVLVIKRISTLEAKEGVGIDSMVLTPIGR